MTLDWHLVVNPIHIFVYTKDGRITRTRGHGMIPYKKIRTKYGLKFVHLIFSFEKSRV